MVPFFVANLLSHKLCNTFPSTLSYIFISKKPFFSVFFRRKESSASGFNSGWRPLFLKKNKKDTFAPSIVRALMLLHHATQISAAVEKEKSVSLIDIARRHGKGVATLHPLVYTFRSHQPLLNPKQPQPPPHPPSPFPTHQTRTSVMNKSGRPLPHTAVATCERVYPANAQRMHGRTVERQPATNTLTRNNHGGDYD